MTKKAPCLISAKIEIIISIIAEFSSWLIVHASDKAANVIMLKIKLSMRNGKIIFFLFISVAIELCGRRSTADTRIMKIPITVKAMKNWAP